MEYAVGTTLVLVLMGIQVIFFDSFMKRKNGKLLFWGSIIILSLVNVFSMVILKQWILVRQVITVVAGAVLAKSLYDTTILRGAFISVLFLAIASLVDIVTSHLLISMTGATLNELRMGFASFLIGAGISHVTLLAITLVLRKIFAAKVEKQPLGYIEILRLLLFPVVSAFVLATMFNTATINEDMPLMVFMSVVGLLLANLSLVFIFDRLEREYKLREENGLLHQQIRLEASNLSALMEYRDAQRRIAHDYSNHLNAVNALLENEDYSEAKAYLGGLIDKHESTHYVIRTNNPVADAILNLKYVLAKKDNIHMMVETNDLSQFPLRSEELATVLTNLLDNAIEACTKVRENPEISVKMIFSSSESLISIRNTTAYPVNINDNHVQTTKTPSALHGFGLKNVESVLLRHDYDYAVGYSDGWFQFTAIL